jgi:lipoate-protein ligase A
MLRLITDLHPADPALGLALDEALLENGQSTLRLWVNDRSVIIGRSQTVCSEVDQRYASEQKIPILRRMSGGGTVYHYPGNLNISLVMPDTGKLNTISSTYAIIGKAIRAALSSLRVPARVEGNALLIGGAKIGGAAQVRRRNTLLYHTTLLVQRSVVPMERILLAMQPTYRPTHVASHPRQITTISRFYPEITLNDLVYPLAQGIASNIAETVENGEYEQDELSSANELRETKYGCDEWNLSR